MVKEVVPEAAPDVGGGFDDRGAKVLVALDHDKVLGFGEHLEGTELVG